MTIVKVEGTTFVRDTKTMALINTDISGLEEYKFKSKLLNNEVKDDVKIIKELLLKLSGNQ
jgi:hypothetical protein